MPRIINLVSAVSLEGQGISSFGLRLRSGRIHCGGAVSLIDSSLARTVNAKVLATGSRDCSSLVYSSVGAFGIAEQQLQQGVVRAGGVPSGRANGQRGRW